MTLWATLFSAGMLAAAVSDVTRRRIPNWLNLSIFFAGLLAQVVGGGPTALGQGLAGAGVGLILLLPLFHFRWIGGGDVKLVVAAGAWLSPALAFWSTIIGLAGGGVIALVIALTGGAELRTEVLGNLRSAAFTMSAPHAPRREKRQLVPMAVALAGAALGVFFAAGGL
jgi:Flp pilus assembly protein protease CpaA